MKLISINEPGTHSNSIIQFLKERAFTESGQHITFEESPLQVSQNLSDEDSQALLLTFRKAFSGQEPALFLSSLPGIEEYTILAFAERHTTGGILIISASIGPRIERVDRVEGTILSHLIEHHGIHSFRFILAGIRGHFKDDSEFLSQKATAVFPMKTISEEGLPDMCHSIMEACQAFPAIFAIVNLNAVDPAFAPSVHDLHPGGLTSREMLHLTQKLMLLPGIKGVHVLGLNPLHDINDVTARLAAAICGEIIGSLGGARRCQVHMDSTATRLQGARNAEATTDLETA